MGKFPNRILWENFPLGEPYITCNETDIQNVDVYIHVLYTCTTSPGILAGPQEGFQRKLNTCMIRYKKDGIIRICV